MALTSPPPDCGGRQTQSDLRESKIGELLAVMTPMEKLGQLTQLFSGRTPADLDEAASLSGIRRGRIGSFIWAFQEPRLRNRLQREAVECSRLGIPLLFGMDIIHGARTVFPIPIGLSCAFDPDLFERAQKIAARESVSMGINWIFTPMCDLARDPRWGRVAETCGEDPYHSAHCNAAQVRGLQGDGHERTAVAACLKHFAGYSAVVGGRDYNEAEISQWTFRNFHLPPFHAGIREGALTVMSAFNTLEGVPMVANRRILTGILREEWGFPGFVVSDWQAVEEMISWGYAADRAEASRLAIQAGNDMDMLTGSYLETLEHEMEEGQLDSAVLDEAVRRVLRVKMILGLFENPYCEESPQGIVLRQEELDFCQECVVQSAVLVKNSGVLPLGDVPGRIALIGPFADDPFEMIGCWAEWGRPEDVVTLADGLRARYGSTVVESVKGCGVNTVARTRTLQDGTLVSEQDGGVGAFQAEEVLGAVRRADVVIMALGEARSWTGENATRAGLGLTGEQQKLFDLVAAEGKPMITVLFSGRPLVVPAVWERSDAVLYAWQPGIRAGAGLSELLAGYKSPSGRLSISVLKDIAQAPLVYNHPRTGRPGQGQAREGGMRSAQYWFGHGLSYTTFSYESLRIENSGVCAEAVARIKNSGSREGVETVQLYIRQIACSEGVRPQQELRGYRKIRLQPGEEQEVRFELSDEVLGYLTRDGVRRMDAGSYEVWISPRSCEGVPVVYCHDPSRGRWMSNDAGNTSPEATVN